MIHGKRILDRFADNAVPSVETIPIQPLLELCGDHRALIEHHKGVSEYSAEVITVKVKYGSLRISGDRLEICRMSSDQLVITGRIDSITVVRGRM